jgi:hypothetical protein
MEKPPTIKILPLRTNTKGMIHYSRTHIMNKCLNSVKVQSNLAKPTKEFVDLILYYLEEEEIKALLDPTTTSSTVLSTMLNKVANETKTNIMVLLGHVNECATKIKKINFLEEKEQMTNPYPLIVLVIGCHSDTIAEAYNKSKTIENNILFLGFKDMMHGYKGEIYMCENPLVADPNLDCRYPGSYENLKDLISKKNNNKGLTFDDLAKKYKIFECCDIRMKQYENIYVDAFNTRKCARLSANDLAKIILPLKMDDTTLHKKDYLKEHHPKKRKYYIIDSSEGTYCTATQKCVTSTKEYDKQIAKFDKETAHWKVKDNILDIISKSHRDMTPEVQTSNDSKLATYLGSISKEQAKKELERKIGYSDAVFFYIFKFKYNLSKKFIYECNVDLTIKDEKGNVFLKDIIWENNFHLLATEQSTNLQRQAPIYYTTKELYRLFMEVYEKDPNVFLSQTYYENKTLLGSSLLDKYKMNYPLILFYFDKFPGQGDNYGKNILKDLFEAAQRDYDDLFINLLEMFFINGVDPNTEEQDILEKYIKQHKGTLDAAIINLFVAYGYKNIEFLQKQRNIYGSILSSTILRNEAINSMSIEGNPLDYFRNRYEALSLEKIPPAMSVYQLKPVLKKALNPYEKAREGIQGVKKLFSNIRNYTKKANMDKNTKKAFLDEILDIYKSKQGNENEGNSALRRMNRMQSVFQEFKNLEENIHRPPQPARDPMNNGSAWGGGTRKRRR